MNNICPPPNKQLEIFFKTELKNCEFTYVPNFGNAGDALIALGTFKFFDRLGLRWKLCQDWRKLQKKTVVFAGGGALVGHYRRSEAALEGLLLNDNKVIVLPHTITRLNDAVLRWGENLVIFCRENRTYEYVSSFKQISHVGLDHDMAFQLAGSVDALLDSSFSYRLASAFADGSLKDRLRVVKRLPKALSARYQTARLRTRFPEIPLNCFRSDVESVGQALPEDNHDISDSYALGTEAVEAIRLSGYALLATLEKFPVVRTDRLHCCIGAMLLGKRVEFYGNNYHKNKSVYQFSIQEWSDRVIWKERQTIDVAN